MSDMPEVIWVDSGRKGSDWWTREADQDDCALGYEWDTQYTRTDIVDDLTTQLDGWKMVCQQSLRIAIEQRDDLTEQLANMTIERNGHKANAREAVIARDNLAKQLSDLREDNAGLLAAHDAAAFVAALPAQENKA